MTYLCVGHKRVIRAEGLQTNFKDLLMHLQGLRVLGLLLIHNGNIVFGASRKRVVVAVNLLFDSKLLLPQLQCLSMLSLRKIDSCNIALGLSHD